MISLSAAVVIVVYLLVAMIIFGLLFWLVSYCSGQMPAVAPFAWVANVILAILAVLVLIGILLSFVAGQPLFRP